MPETLQKYIDRAYKLIESALTLIADETSDPAKLTQCMNDLTQTMEEMKTCPEDVWRQKNEEILALSAKIDRLQEALAKSHAQAQSALVSGQQRIKAQQSYAAAAKTEQNKDD